MNLARRIVFLALIAFMLAGPFYVQVLDRPSVVFRRWTMFGGAGIGLAEASFTRRHPDGRETALDRYAVLGYGSRADAPTEVVRIRGLRGAWEIAQRLCAELGPGADVRVVSREATRDGWTPGYDGTTNLCTAPPPEPERDDAR